MILILSVNYPEKTIAPLQSSRPCYTPAHKGGHCKPATLHDLNPIKSRLFSKQPNKTVFSVSVGTTSFGIKKRIVRLANGARYGPGKDHHPFPPLKRPDPNLVRRSSPSGNKNPGMSGRKKAPFRLHISLGLRVQGSGKCQISPNLVPINGGMCNVII